MVGNTLIALALATLAAGCVADPGGGATQDGGPGTGGSGTGGAVVTGSGGSPGSGGATGPGTGGSTGTGGSGMAGNVGTGGGAGFDNGTLFGDAAVGLAGASGTDASVSPDGPPSEGGPVIPGDGNVAISTITGGLNGRAEFTQRGVDVTVVINLTNCAAGNHAIRIHDGFSCDNVSTQGKIWDGQRGDGIGGPMSIINCTAARTGTLTYTRPGNNPALNWTVADHNLATDVSAHVLIVTDPANAATRQACGNFF